MSELKETQEVTKADEPPKQEQKVVHTIPKGTPPAETIEPFDWSYNWQYKTVEQDMPPAYLPEHAIHYLRIEEGFDPVPPEKPVDERWREEDAVGVGQRLKECPKCEGLNYVRKRFIGQKTKIRVDMPVSCRCVFYRMYYSRWMNPSRVPADYRQVKLSNISNYRDAFRSFPGEAFDNLINTVKTYKYNCYLLTGPAGSGKSTLMTAMYHVALARWPDQAFRSNLHTEAVWKINASELSKQFRAWKRTSRLPTPHLHLCDRRQGERANRAGWRTASDGRTSGVRLRAHHRTWRSQFGSDRGAVCKNSNSRITPCTGHSTAEIVLRYHFGQVAPLVLRRKPARFLCLRQRLANLRAEQIFAPV